ncbi:MAG: flagellar protein FlgN [Candidimonas sp.]|nr:MAG: flagellar protein FlgN [Candidimonas sp.]TAM25581.1 MAG: flagellar protein FlgN [Candidimonas sp.]
MSEPLQPLQRCLRQEATLIQRFISVLQAEAQALGHTADTDALTASTQEKNHFFDLLAQIDQERQAQLHELGYSADKAGLDAAADAYPALKPLCLDVFDLAKQASELNALNGAVIDIHLRRNQRAIDALRRLGNIDPLYDASGRTHGMPVHRKNIRAG